MKLFQAKLFWAIVISLTVLFSGSNIYAADCAVATIKRIGDNPVSGAALGASPHMVQLDCADDSQWTNELTLYLSQDLGDAGLATLLSAYSLEKTIWVRTLGTAPGSIITVIFLND